MKVLELFAGSKSFSNNAKKLGLETFSVDWEQFEGIDLVADIEYLQASQIPFIPDIIWASPDCATYSVAALGTHRDGITPLTEYARKCDRVNTNLINLIKHYLLINPDMIYFVENPRGMMRKMPFMENIPRITVWYCTYGDKRAKPTDIFSNNIYSMFNTCGWVPRKECFNGNRKCHHEIAPRGSKTGTQGIDGDYERAKIPDELCIEILKSVL